ncbi:hypothetical protein PVAND_006575 [Polypedilum vanderplanki]|uniref:Grh/CP2 DB domain-containing protein n=1 Tax=Polypedilum vanderplanki TaxID=319348 RepID=A0A9J6C5A5_POLVA|nr:hypothetical protein PVAND_006575 [Polypedilum vanderplanki]
MALTVPQPASSLSLSDQFGWLFHNNCHFDASIYQDDDEIMEFSDSSVEYSTYQHTSQQQTQMRSYNNYNAHLNQSSFNMNNGNNDVTQQTSNVKSYVDLVDDDDSPNNSKEAWPAEYVKTVLLGTSSEANDCSRKRKGDWSHYPNPNNGQQQLSESAPNTKMIKDRRKSQGRITTWPEDIDIDLSTELMSSNQYSNDSLLNFPNLTVFKTEIPSPTNQGNNSNNNITSNGNDLLKSSRSPNQTHFRNMSPTQCIRITQQMGTASGMVNGQQQQINDQQANGSTSSSNGLANFLEQLEGSSGQGGNGNNQQNDEQNIRGTSNSDESRFQYVLAAATSIATKNNEETLTYLNQGQSYEIKLKKLGDLSTCRGKIMKSVIKICFHERRLQYMEREQMCIWQSSRPGERILDIDIPLSYGLLHVNHSPLLNTAEILWDALKEVGVYIKVNCISTEFTPKKHGGEKGVPFRIQIETYIDGVPDTKPLHAAACQIKVFKLKGADRKHKQDRERIQKRPLSEQDKYQRSYECTILNDISSENIVTSTIGSYSPEHIKRNLSPIIIPTSPIHVPSNMNSLMPFVTSIGNVSSTNGLCKLDQTVVSTQSYDSDDLNSTSITKDSSPQQLAQWLLFHRLGAYSNIFSSFSGCDLLRLAKEDLIQICGLADGIRMYNILHAKAIKPRLTIFVSVEGNNTYNAVYLHSTTTKELIQKLYKVPGMSSWKFSSSSSPRGSNSNLNDESNFKIYTNGPNNVLVLVTDEVLANIKDESLFALEFNNGSILMKSVKKSD